MATLELNSVLFEEINRSVQDYLFHPYLTRCDIAPSASRFHFDVALAVLRSASVQEQEVRGILTAVLLLQRGLSIHDDIEEQAGRRRQLYVLTGDYSSSQYYYVLSHLGNASLLYDLCDSVMRVNQAKMTLLDLPAKAPFQQKVLNYAVVEGDLLYTLVKYYINPPETWLSQVESLVQAYIFKEMPTLAGHRDVPFREGYEWLAAIMQRLSSPQSNVILEPITTLFLDYLRTTQKNFERYLTLSEGNS